MRKLPVLLLALALILCSAYVPEQASSAGVVGTDIVGRAINETGAAFPGVEIRATNVTTLVTYKATTGADGNYTMPSNFVPGLYNVTASFLNHSANVSYSNVLVKSGQSARLNFTMLEVLCKLTGFVTNGTTPVYGATVTLINEQRSYSNVSVNPLGKYEIPKVQPGTYTVVASKVGYYSSDPMPPVVLIRGETKSVDFVLQEQPAELGGKVEYDGSGLKGVTVKLSSSLFTAETVTDEDGNYTFSQVPSGSYTITFSKESFLTNSMSVGLTPFEVRELDVEMEYDNANNTQTFLLGLDLAHSLMVIGLTVSIMVLVVGIYVNYKIRRKPELLDRDDSEKD
ncbi:MAG: carboxypeptidase regulatory-like domain-containing protein [Methanomassiliicoccales archaeon]|nr:carboxypeptidase regulatory-like domain-containing protein [Methanomassiliicoccales archaeon]